MRPSRFAAFFTLLALACGGAQKTPAPEPKPPSDEPIAVAEPVGPSWAPLPDSPAEAPGSLLGVVTLGNPTAQLRALGDYVNSVQPGPAAGMLNATLLAQGFGEMVGTTTLEGFDFGKPVHVLILDPKQASEWILIAGAAADQGQLEAAAAEGSGLYVRAHEGFAVIGGKGAIETASAYALTNLVTQKAPAHPTATVYVARIAESYLPEIEAARATIEAIMAQSGKGAQLGGVFKAYADALLAVFRQTDRAVLTMEAGAADLSFHANLVVKDGGTVKAFAKAQAPSDYAGVSRLPAGMGMVVSGRIDWTPAMPFFLRIYEGVWTAMYGEWNEESQKAMEELVALFSGDAAMGIDMSLDDMTMVGLFGVKDAKQAQALFRGFWSLLTRQKSGPMTWKLRKNAFRHKKARLDELIGKPSKEMPEEQRQAMEKMFGKKGMTMLIGAAGESVVMVTAKDVKAIGKKLLDGVDTPTEPTGGLADALADSRARGESFVMYFDPAMLAAMGNGGGGAAPASAGGPGFGVGMGFVDGNVQFRVSIPAAAVTALQSP